MTKRELTTGISAPGFKQTLLFGNNEVMEGNQMYNGNQPVNATDHADPVNTEGPTDFKDENNGNFQDYTFNGTGALTSDKNKNITRIKYDNLNRPRSTIVKSSVKTTTFIQQQNSQTPQSQAVVKYRLTSCKKPPNAMQHTAFHQAKGGLLQSKKKGREKK